MPVQKLVLQLTVMCDTDTLEEAVDAYSSMTLEQIQHSTAFGEDIGSGVSIVASETIDGREKIVAELQEIGNDGTFFDYALEEEDAQVSATRRSEEHTSELQSLMRISYAVFCLKKKKKEMKRTHMHSGPKYTSDTQFT